MRKISLSVAFLFLAALPFGCASSPNSGATGSGGSSGGSSGSSGSSARTGGASGGSNSTGGASGGSNSTGGASGGSNSTGGASGGSTRPAAVARRMRPAAPAELAGTQPEARPRGPAVARRIQPVVSMEPAERRPEGPGELRRAGKPRFMMAGATLPAATGVMHRMPLAAR